MLGGIQLQVKERKVKSNLKAEAPTVPVGHSIQGYANKHLPNAHETKRSVVNDASSDRQIICGMFGRWQSRANKEAGDEKQGAIHGGTDSHTVCEPYAPVEQVIQHDGM